MLSSYTGKFCFPGVCENPWLQGLTENMLCFLGLGGGAGLEL